MKFNYYNPTRLVFGAGRIKETVDNIPKGVKKVLIHYGSERMRKDGTITTIQAEMKHKGIESILFGGVVANPRLSMVKQGMEIVKRENIDFILAVGGGSVIDSAKAISAGHAYDGEIWDMFIGKAEVPEKGLLPLGVVLSFPATGSEDSTGCVINNEITKEKRSIGSDYLRPVFSILDPNLTLSLPDRQTFAGIVDMFSHILERYMVNDDEYGLMDTMSEGLMRSIIKAAYILKDDSKNLWAREQVMISSTLAHNDILGLGRDEDWASHRIGHELSALYDAIHGETLAIIFPAWMEYVKDINPNRIIRFGKEVFRLGEDTTVEETIKAFREFLKDIGMPLYLKDLNIGETDIEEMAKKCTLYGDVGTFKKLNCTDVENIYRLAL
ncbi:MAG: iron-containing alcohol dehydrogenase [Tissierellia bacterium]|nr:iron-containing alcohol dehydrogenase [Tissierellia bacterium]